MANYKFNTLGVMIDMSRNAVMSIEGLKKFLPLLKKMGYNCVMLYTEDTYEIEGEPFFGYMRGRYSVEEMKEIDAFAASLGIEIIPCIQTLGHLATIKRWGKFRMETKDILLVDDEKTYELIDKMFSTLSKCFASRRIHIGMDETHDLGRGKLLDKNGYEPVSAIMKRHLDKVTKIAEKYGYEPMMWSDMFFRPWVEKHGYYAPRAEVPKDYIDALPKSVIPVYWDYYHTKKESYDDMFYNHAQLSKKTWFAGGIWSWQGFAPFNQFSIKSMIPAIESCKEHKIKNAVFAMWGDCGAECSRLTLLPSLFYVAQYAKGITDESVIKAKFKRLIGIDFDDFIKLDDINMVKGDEDIHQIPTPKYALYSDCFAGFLDVTMKEGGSKYFASLSKELASIAKKSRKYGYLFDTQAKLCDVLTIKYELGIKTFNAYKSGDKEELRRLANEDYAKLITLVERFSRSFEKQWMAENKAFGFDVQDIRIGGVIKRLSSCRRRLLDYVNGKTDRIDELEEERLTDLATSCYFLNNYEYVSTVNVLE